MDKKLEMIIEGQYFYASLEEDSICVMRRDVEGIAIVNFKFPSLDFKSSIFWPNAKEITMTVVSEEFNGDTDTFKIAARELVGDVDSCG